LPVFSADRREKNLQLAIGDSPVSALTQDFSQSFEQHHGLVFRTAYRITGNAADAEDVLQTIFLRLLKRDSGGAALQNEESYLRRAAVNASVDLIRARRAEREVPLSETLAQKPPLGSDLRDALRKALLRLTPQLAEIFALRYFEDFSNQQIAELLNISQVLVAVKLHRARRQLRNELRSSLGGSI
jgi:RNA polymerase sigma-70 factor, ECF subfamily